MRTILFGLIVAIGICTFTPIKHNQRYRNGFECGVIVSKMNILTDTGTGEYLRLSNKYNKLKCYYDNPDEDIVLYIQQM